MHGLRARANELLDEVEAELDRLIQENEELREKLAETLRGGVPTMAAPIADPPLEGFSPLPDSSEPPLGVPEASERERPVDEHISQPRPAPPEPSAPAPARQHRHLPPAPDVTPPDPFPAVRSVAQPDPASVGRPGSLSPRHRRSVSPPTESVEVHDDGEIRVISFEATERLLFDRGADGQILNWTTALSPSAAGELALELAATAETEEATICVSGETGDISPRLIASLIRAHPPSFDRSCEFFRIDFDDQSIAYQRLPQESGPPIGFLGIAAERLSLALVAPLIVRTGTQQVVDAALDLGGYRLLDQLDRLLADTASIEAAERTSDEQS